VCRRSCGCEFEAHPRGAPAGPKHGAPSGLVERLQALRPKLASALRVPPEEAVSVSHRLIESLLAEHTGAERAFPKAVADLLEDLGDDTTCHTVLREAIAFLREELSDPGAGWIERACFEGLNLVACASTTHEERRRLSLEDSYATLLNISEQAAVAFDLASLRQTMCRDLPAAGVRTMYLSCAVDEAASELAPVVCLVDAEPADVPETSFPASRLLPPSALSRDPRRTYLVFPLAAESGLLGVAAFDHADGVRSYAVFRNELTGVLKSLRLHHELVQKTTLHERSVQERLAATKRMESLSVLAGGVAHDLNNALGPLVALPDLILRELHRLPDGGPAVGKISADIEIIKSASLRAAQTIKDLLTLGRQGRTAKEFLDLHRVVKSCVAECSLRLVEDKSRSVRLAADYFAKPLAVRGSETQLARAIGNLLRNALEALNGDGKVVLQTRLEHLAAPVAAFETIPAGDYAVVTVTDDGCGIDPLELPRVFEPFWSRKRAGESSGSGLGLAIVHGVVKEHDGFIDVSSLLGKGSSFSLYLPLAQPARSVERPAPATLRGPARILVVDDEDVQLRTCRRALRELGHDVDTLPSGMRAYQMFKQAAPTGKSPYDLLVMDMVLGETLDGLQILDLIHQLFPEQKAILASGNAPNDRAELAVRRGLLWLAKPYTIEALTHALERVFLQAPAR
jgi:signal transduction histidine kinase/ActR/RegA family two-component response regulator